MMSEREDFYKMCSECGKMNVCAIFHVIEEYKLAYKASDMELTCKYWVEEEE